MNTTRVPNAWYADAAPGGRYAVLVTASHVQTDSGIVPIPQENVLYLRATWQQGVMHLAGTGHQTDKAWHWNGINWEEVGGAYGVNPCAFDTGAVLVCHGGNSCERKPFVGLPSYTFPLISGSQGIRWVRPDGVIVTADSTYADPARGLYGYTDYGDVAFGEADDGVGGGCVLRFADDGVLRRVEAGQVRFVRAQREGDEVALAYTRQDTRECVVVWATLAELRQMPPVSQPLPPDVVVPPAPPHLRMCGYFYRDTSVHAFLKKWGDENHEAPGTHSIIIDDFGLPAEARSDGTVPRMIVGVGQLLHAQMPSWWPRVDAVYVAVEGDQAALANLMELARTIMDWRGLPRKPILTYSGPTVYPAAHQPEDILGVQLYADQGTDPAANIRLQAARYWPQIQGVPKVAIIGQAYDRLDWFTGAQCAAIQPVLYDIACQWPNCVGLFWFSDSREGGTRDHEEMRPWHQAISTAITR